MMALRSSKFILVILVLLLIQSCGSKRTNEAKRVAKIKADHEELLKLKLSLPDPFAKEIPDSMKRWSEILRKVHVADQKYRIIGYPVMTALEVKEQRRLDSINLSIVAGFLDKFGWPSVHTVGLFGLLAVNATIQHAPLEVQESYYPKLVQAFKKDSLLFETVALLEDRINIKRNRRQYYGSQTISYQGKYTLYPVVDIDGIDSIRSKIGIKMPIRQYMAMLKMDWDPADYKRKLPELVKHFKVSDTAGLHFVR